ncbi:hypothetical protein E2C01_102556 [Portunus trituberculatus]|uniref:Uncharacterized protein n=1 Tax=Portunus trituberculatus TaxID=210409 RepID=A0A5B7KCX5_PORTR|nr:hypothetical protein [Portunus trituberculatus]
MCELREKTPPLHLGRVSAQRTRLNKSNNFAPSVKLTLARHDPPPDPSLPPNSDQGFQLVTNSELGGKLCLKLH